MGKFWVVEIWLVICITAKQNGCSIFK